MKNNTYRLVLMALLTALLFVGQIIMGVLPNIEIVSLLVILYTVFFGRKVFLIIYTFVFLEGFFYGFGIWWFNYIYIWSILAITVLAFRKNTSVMTWSIISGFFGLFFGTLCSVPYFITGGFAAGISYITAGLMFDITHCIGNFFVCLILYKPLYRLLDMAVNKA